ATEHLLGLADDFRPRKIDLGLANGRRFVFACGAGLDATAARKVDSHPRMKARGGRWYYTWAAVSGFYRSYLRNPVRMRLEADRTIRAFPVQLDGDYIGEHSEVDIGIEPAALTVVA